MKDAYEVAESIAAQRPQLRTISEGWCPTCTKLVAAVVVYNGEAWLYEVGGRSGSHAEMVTEFETSLRDAEADEARYAQLGRSDLVEIAADVAVEFRRLLEEIRENRWPGWTPAMARPVSQFQLSALGPMETIAACRGCRRDMALRLSPNLALTIAPRVAEA